MLLCNYVWDFNISVGVWHHPFKTRWLCRPGQATVKENDPTDRPVGKATVTSGLRLGSLELEARPAGLKPGTPHHRSLGGEWRGKRKCLMIFLERWKKCPHQSDKHWNCVKCFSEHGYHPELNWGLFCSHCSKGLLATCCVYVVTRRVGFVFIAPRACWLHAM